MVHDIIGIIQREIEEKNRIKQIDYILSRAVENYTKLYLILRKRGFFKTRLRPTSLIVHLIGKFRLSLIILYDDNEDSYINAVLLWSNKVCHIDQVGYDRSKNFRTINHLILEIMWLKKSIEKQKLNEFVEQSFLL